MDIRFANDTYGYLQHDIGADDEDVRLLVGDAVKGEFPELSGDHYCYLSLVPRGMQDTKEIVMATLFEDGVFTVTRGVDGTEPVPHIKDTKVSVRLVSASLYALHNEAVANATVRMEAMFKLLGEQLNHYSEFLNADLPIRSGEDELNEDTLNEQAIVLSNKVDALTSALSTVATHVARA